MRVSIARFGVSLAIAVAALLPSASGHAQGRVSLRGTGLVPSVNPVRIEGPLAHFHAALRALERDPHRRVRVLHYGDSNVAADLWTSVARDAFQARFGDGGSGYLLPRGHASWHRGATHLSVEGRWESRRRGFGGSFGPIDGLWGLAGVAIEPATPGARLIIEVPDRPIEQIVELHFLGRPHPGGAVTVSIDGGAPERVSVHREQPGLVLRRYRLAPGPHRVRVRHVGGVPRLLGVVVEAQSGIVYDVLGINGHRASAINHWNAELWQSQLAHRAPDLVVLSYGGNEALDPNLSLAAYEQRTRQAIATTRRVAPEASCLLVGPIATMERYADRMRAVAEVQRRLGAELGCAFWDSSQTSGGPGTLGRWVRYPGMVGGDRLHLGRTGYELVGREFVHALLSDL